MNWRTKRKLQHSLKLAGIIAAAAYMVTGVCSLKTVAEERIQVQASEPVQLTEKETAIVKEPEIIPTTKPEPETNESLIKSRDWSAEESYLLAKIAMAEAEGEDVEGKALVMLVVLNRVWSDGYPDSIEEVIFQYNERTGVYQFSTLYPDGRWWTTEPNEECWEALDLIMIDGWDESRGSLYFESDSDSEWHRDNLKYLFTHGGHYFYTEKE